MARWTFVVAAMATFASAQVSLAQLPASNPISGRAAPQQPASPSPGNGWRPATDDPPVAKTAQATKSDSTSDSSKTVSTPRQPIAKVTNGNGTLPNDRGQVWREYDITPFTARATNNNKPEQSIVDWILRETSYEAWHSDVACLLSADKKALRVYHTPEMQTTVAEVVDRFVNPEAESSGFGVRALTVSSPNWRAKFQRTLRPVTTQTQGAQAWLMTKEDAALLLAEFRKRNDVRELGSPQLIIYNGQTASISTLRPRNYVRGISLRSDPWPAFEPESAQLQEGLTLELSPLVSIDGKTADAIVKCNIDQVEKLIPVSLDVPTSVAPRQRTQVDVPQMAAFRLHEKFRWPVDQVLLVSLGVVATPIPGDSGGQWLLPTSGPGRSDMVLLIDCKGKQQARPSANVANAPATPAAAPTYQGRY